jgi:mRNA-degrading endonuclease toxin of MazEF toxin-antitoxin module
MRRERGAVCWSDDPFKDDTDAGRPWLVVSTGGHPFADEQSMVVALSTSGHDAALLISDEAWREGKTPRRSYVLPWAVHSVRNERIEERLGVLEQSFVDSVVTELRQYIEPAD